MSDDVPTTSVLGPWNPGIGSTIPRDLYSRVTIYDPDNAAMPLAEIEELAAVSGLPMHEIVELRAERLVLHEVLIRATAELSIDDGPLQSDLGLNFRRTVNLIFDRHMAPRMPEFVAAHTQVRNDLIAAIDAACGEMETPPPLPASHTSAPPRGWIASWRRRSPGADAVRPARPAVDETLHRLGAWHRRALEASSEFDRVVYRALLKAGNALASRQSNLAGRAPLLRRLATALAANELASRQLGEHVAPLFDSAVHAEGLRRLPVQARPIVMNTKGASAAGKSTLRPKQRGLAERIGANWADFAIISPDIWRKQLLDYATLGAARRYAGMLTGYEVEIIDRKLDRHIAARAEAGLRTHLLIDRFRFDSFSPTADDGGTQLLTRFGSEVYMYFMITPPEATVERAWLRGERVGRYKAVDDLLAHNIEAYNGFPGLLFRWAASRDKVVHFEFLDNSVAEGEVPRTVAFGRNGEMAIVDLDRLLDIDRFKRINIAAATPTDVYVAPTSARPPDDLVFLRDCIRRIDSVVLAKHDTGEVYAEFRTGNLVDWRPRLLAEAVLSEPARQFIEAQAVAAGLGDKRDVPGRRFAPVTHRTLGAWGHRMPAR
jgi:hypothetical protein